MFHTVLFDIDGVLLSEERYFDASALTIYELLTSPTYLGLKIAELPPFTVDVSEAEIRHIRKVVFANDDVLQTMKSRGVNANWDMVYLQFGFVLASYLREAIIDETLKEEILATVVANGWSHTALQTLGVALRNARISESFPNQFGAYVSVFEGATSKEALFQGLDDWLTSAKGDILSTILPMSTNRLLWDVGQQCFQEWYLGDKYITSARQSGKRGFLSEEVPLVPPIAFSKLLEKLQAANITLGIATGRPAIETHVPLTDLGWMHWFAERRISTASDVLAAEAAVPHAAPLSKPHPYSYVRSMLASVEVSEVLNCPLPLPTELAAGLLIVGDSVADFLAAQKMGCVFAAVLTGLDGEQARETFVQLGVEWIVDNVLEIEKIVL